MLPSFTGDNSEVYGTSSTSLGFDGPIRQRWREETAGGDQAAVVFVVYFSSKILYTNEKTGKNSGDYKTTTNNICRALRADLDTSQDSVTVRRSRFGSSGAIRRHHGNNISIQWGAGVRTGFRIYYQLQY